MGVFSLSDIIIAVTLLANAIALMSSKVYKETAPKSNNNDDTSSETSGLVTHCDNKALEVTHLSRLYTFLNLMRRLSCIIVVWNIFFIILMLFVFRS